MPLLRILLFLLCASSALAQADPFSAVIAEVEEIQAEAGMRTAAIGLCIIPLDAESSDPGSGYHPDTSLVPASTMKLITTAAAVELLGGDFRFTTRLQHTGTIAEDGTLEGDIVIAGGGDPTLGSSGIATIFTRWHEALTEAGIARVEGSIVGDASIFGTQLLPDSWQWNDLGNYYAAGACGLTFHQNQFFCNFRTSGPGTPATFIGTDPRLPGIEFVNEIRAGPPGSGDEGYLYGTPYTNLFYLRGTLPPNRSTYTIKGSLPDPAFFCARAFTKHLLDHDFQVAQSPTTERLLKIAGKSLGARHPITEEQSDPLSSLLVVTNHKSNNLRSECIHRMIGVEVSGEGSTIAASKAVTAHWGSKGIDMTGFFMEDGCGLSRANAVTPRQLTMMLYHAAKAPEFETFYASLPTVGRSGTLATIGRGSPAEGKIRAKSGTLDRVRNYAGYVDADSGRQYAFTLFFNNYTCDLSEVKAKIVRIWSHMVLL